MLTVFFVEDSTVMGRRLRQLLSRIPGVVVVGEACRLRDLVQSVDHAKPDVVLLDIRLPDGIGFDAIAPLQQLEFAPKIFMVTAHGDAQYRARATRLNVDGFFDKAAELEALAAQLAGLCKTKLKPGNV
ncbi:response regulator [Marinobacter fonticola]|uniref:response regulator n=1 Tax=Marinobacter fonticola TaxID=2603215 RepID=UPI0011E7DAD6|nr:response regulator transcription factor [Marinobacter fonticola]